MKKIIAMIGMGAVLSLVPACKKSNIMPQEISASNSIEQRDPGLPLQPVQLNTRLYVMLSSKPCLKPQKEYTSLKVEIKGVRVYNTISGWEELKPIDAAWDLVNMQQQDIPGLNITQATAVHAGEITKVALTFGDHNELAVNNQPASCFKLGAREVVLDLKGKVKKDAVNELLLSIDICGNINAEMIADGTKCFVLKPAMQFERLTVKMIK